MILKKKILNTFLIYVMLACLLFIVELAIKYPGKMPNLSQILETADTFFYSFIILFVIHTTVLIFKHRRKRNLKS